MIFQAHKGVSTEYPENTMPAIAAAIEQGYGSIELDVSVTKDLQFVLLHDGTINRTARMENGESLPETVPIGDITYDEALRYDFGSWFSRKFKGTRIPLFAEALRLAQHSGTRVKIDNKYQNFPEEQKAAFLDFLRPYADIACLTCSRTEELERACALLPGMHFHYDGPVNAETLHRLGELLPKEQLTIWLPHKNPNTAWVTVDFASPEAAARVKQYGSLGVWILSKYDQLDEAEALGADIIETNGQLKPPADTGVIADMHTHSEHSHDSVCKIEDMRAAQREKGTQIFAVTDHFDTDSRLAYDVFSPIAAAAKTAAALNARQDGGPLVLAGIEISEGFWHPEVCRRALTLTAYDVVIGSVHLVKYPQLSYAYSAIDFSKLDAGTTARFMDAYFDDMLTMLDSLDFDILAHLTCPVRYINGKFGCGLSLDRYAEKIEVILRRIIQSGIALEVNTSSFALLDDFMPTAKILQKYYDLGGYLITLGSDAHTAQNASIHFDKAIQTLKAIGFRNIFYYKGRKPQPLSI
ncbi:MAG: PHP domain-containing protein [Oscillospiraceae bacterium]|nr:PHP domain-containing protein [Oscillospiraceae bacterium]